jgi:hypothetical protein
VLDNQMGISPLAFLCFVDSRATSLFHKRRRGHWAYNVVPNHLSESNLHRGPNCEHPKRENRRRSQSSTSVSTVRQNRRRWV